MSFSYCTKILEIYIILQLRKHEQCCGAGPFLTGCDSGFFLSPTLVPASGSYNKEGFQTLNFFTTSHLSYYVDKINLFLSIFLSSL